MTWLEILTKIAPTIFEVAAAGIIFVLHQTGADKHKTVAGELAAGLTTAGRVATAVHNELLNGSRPAEPPGGGA